MWRWRSVGVRWAAIAALLAISVGGWLLLAPGPAYAQTSEEFRFRIAARLHENGTHLEFGIQRIDAEGNPRLLHLQNRRFFQLSLNHHRWLTADHAFLVQAPYYDARDLEVIGRPARIYGAKVRVVARIHPTREQVEFGASYELDASQLPGSSDDDYVAPVFPKVRFYPHGIDHHRWLYSSELRFTRVWSGSAMMDAEATMEDDGREVVITPPPPQTTETCLADINLDIDAMLGEECEDLLVAYCEVHPGHAWCVRRRGTG